MKQTVEQISPFYIEIIAIFFLVMILHFSLIFVYFIMNILFP